MSKCLPRPSEPQYEAKKWSEIQNPVLDSLRDLVDDEAAVVAERREGPRVSRRPVANVDRVFVILVNLFGRNNFSTLATKVLLP